MVITSSLRLILSRSNCVTKTPADKVSTNKPILNPTITWGVPAPSTVFSDHSDCQPCPRLSLTSVVPPWWYLHKCWKRYNDRGMRMSMIQPILANGISMTYDVVCVNYVIQTFMSNEDIATVAARQNLIMHSYTVAMWPRKRERQPAWPRELD